MRRLGYIVIFAAMVLVLSVSGCGKQNQNVLEYAERDFSASVEGELDGIGFEALIRVSGDRDEKTGKRDVELEFFAPAALKGIKAVRKDGLVTVSLENLALEDVQADGWLAAADVIVPTGQATNVTPSADKPNLVTVNVGGQTVTVDIDTGAPVAVNAQSPRHISLRVTAFAFEGEGK